MFTAAAPPTLPVSPPPLVLVVDDDERTARRFASMLIEDGFAVEVLRDGAAAIERMSHEPAPAAIVTDWIMPRAGGIAVLGEARRRWRSIPVVFVTGHPELVTHPSTPLGPSPVVFTKPISYPDFSARLHDLVEHAGQ